jgi:hypothetical protein
MAKQSQSQLQAQQQQQPQPATPTLLDNFLNIVAVDDCASTSIGYNSPNNANSNNNVTAKVITPRGDLYYASRNLSASPSIGDIDTVSTFGLLNLSSPSNSNAQGEDDCDNDNDGDEDSVLNGYGADADNAAATAATTSAANNCGSPMNVFQFLNCAAGGN